MARKLRTYINNRKRYRDRVDNRKDTSARYCTRNARAAVARVDRKSYINVDRWRQAEHRGGRTDSDAAAAVSRATSKVSEVEPRRLRR